MYSKKVLSGARFTVENETLVGSHCSNDAALAAYLKSKASNDDCDDFVSNVSLAHCSIGPGSAAALGRALRKNHFLKELRLAYAIASSKSSRTASDQKSSTRSLRHGTKSSGTSSNHGLASRAALWAKMFSGAAKSGEESGLATVVVNHSKLRDADVTAIAACFRGGGHHASSSPTSTSRHPQRGSRRRPRFEASTEEGSEDGDEDFEMGGELSSHESDQSNSDNDYEEALSSTTRSMPDEEVSEVRRHAMRLGLPSASSRQEGENSRPAPGPARSAFSRHNELERGHRVAVGLHFGKAWHAPVLPAVGVGRPPLLRLHLAHNAIGDEGCIALARALKLSPCSDQAPHKYAEVGKSGKKGDIDHDGSDQDDDEEELDCGWSGAPCLRELVLEENRIGDLGAAALAAAIGGCSYHNTHSINNDTIDSDGANNMITSENETKKKRGRAGGGCSACNPRPSLLLASGRERRRGLEVLLLGRNRIGLEGARSLATALHPGSNTLSSRKGSCNNPVAWSLETLSLRSNHIGPSGAAALAASLKAAADATAAANRRRQRLLHSKPGINKSQNSYSKYARSFNAVVGNKSGSDSSRSSSSSSSDDEEDAFGLGGSCSWLSNSESSSSLSGSDNDEAEKDANAFKSLPSPSFSALVHLDLRDNGLGAAAEAMVASAASEHPTLQRVLLQGNGGGGQCGCASCAEALERNTVDPSVESTRGSIRPKWAPGPKNGAALVVTVDPLDLNATDDPSLTTLPNKQLKPPVTPPQPPHSNALTSSAALLAEEDAFSQRTAPREAAVTSDSGNSATPWTEGSLSDDSDGKARATVQLATNKMANSQSAKPGGSPSAMSRDGLVPARMHSSSAHDFALFTVDSSDASRAVSAPISTAAAATMNRQLSGPADELPVPTPAVAYAMRKAEGATSLSGPVVSHNSSAIAPHSMAPAVPLNKRSSGMLAAAFAQRAAAKEKANQLMNNKSQAANNSNNFVRDSLSFASASHNSISTAAFEDLGTDGTIADGSSKNKKGTSARRPRAGLL